MRWVYVWKMSVGILSLARPSNRYIFIESNWNACWWDSQIFAYRNTCGRLSLSPIYQMELFGMFCIHGRLLISKLNRNVSGTWTNVRLHVRWYTLWLRQTVICITLTRFGTLIFHLLHASKTTPMGSTSDRFLVFFSLHFNINIYFENLRHWISKCIKFIWRITHACISIWFESVRKCWIKFSLKKTKSKNKFSHGMSSMQLCM